VSITVPQSPAWAPEQLLPSMRAYLREAGSVRLPKEAGSAPPLWIDPMRGIPYPGQTEGLSPNQTSNFVMAATPATGIASGPFEGFIVKPGVTLWYRAKTSPPIQAKHEEIRSLLHDKRNYLMNGLLVNESLFFRELQRIDSDERGYVYNCEILFTLMAGEYQF